MLPDRTHLDPTRGRVDALDGMRGLAVLAVLAFHLDLDWARGGYLGVSVFFTLSGYLITSLLVAEHRRTGGVSLARFWGRRTRRLLPLGLLGILLAAFVADGIGVTSATRGDLLWALGNLVNWRFLLDGHSYGDLFTAPSPVLHYWSLAVEWQLYLVMPVLALIALARGVRTLQHALLIGCAISWAALVALVAAGEGDAAYYATVTRAGELFAGGVLAVAARRARHVAVPPAGLRRSDLAGVAALAALAIAVVGVGTRPDGGHVLVLPVVAIASTVLIWAASRPGPLARALSLPPLVRLGAWSYALYVVHWPVFLWLSPARTGLGPGPLLLARLIVTFGLAVALHVAVEQPVLRAPTRPGRARRFAAAVAASGATAVAVLGLVAGGPTTQDIEAEARAFEVAASAAEPAQALEDGTRVPSVAFFGDSTAVMTGIGVKMWSEAGAPIAVVPGAVELGCGIELPGRRRVGPDLQVTEKPELCARHLASWAPIVAEHRPDAAVIQVGVWEAADQQVAGGQGWQHLGQPGFDALVLELIGATSDELLAAGAEQVVWLTAPPIDAALNPNHPGSVGPEGDPARFVRLNELIVEMAAARPRVHVVDLAGHLGELPAGELARIRPDGTHLTREAAGDLAARWLGPELLDLLR
ncbi:MAG: acyltransferase family protein [Acidimicrobiia bacterium]